MEFWNDFWQIFSLVFLITAIPMAVIILLEKRSPFKTISWILILILIPVFGVIFYLFFGQQVRKRKIFSKRSKSHKSFQKRANEQLKDIMNGQLDLPSDLLKWNSVIELLLRNSNAVLTHSNHLEIFHNNADFFHTVISSLKAAKRYIHLEYYIFSDDKIGNEVKQILIEKSKQGVEVRIIIDDVGSWGLKKAFIRNLRRNGIQIHSFMEVRFPRLTSRVNFRNHRKILIVDGLEAYTGGSNISDHYLDGLKGVGKWRDTNIKVQGHAVGSLQLIFTSDWLSLTNEKLDHPDYHQTREIKSRLSMQISQSSPESEWPTIYQAFFAAVTNAKKRVYITTPYFMPPASILTAIKVAALSNIDVRLIIPDKSDVHIPRWASFAYIQQLLEAGIRVYLYQDGFIHSKVILVDDDFTSIGTTNFDFRSFDTNFEVNAFIYNTEIAQSVEKQFKTDITHSREINIKEWRRRSGWSKIKESIAHLFAPLM